VPTAKQAIADMESHLIKVVFPAIEYQKVLNSTTLDTVDLPSLGFATITSIGSENVYIEKDGKYYISKVGNPQLYALGEWDFAKYPDGMPATAEPVTQPEQAPVASSLETLKKLSKNTEFDLNPPVVVQTESVPSENEAIIPTLADIKNWENEGDLNFWDKKGKRYYPSNSAEASAVFYQNRTGLVLGGNWYIDADTNKFHFEKLRASNEKSYEHFGLQNATEEQIYSVATKVAYNYLNQLPSTKTKNRNVSGIPVRELSSNMLQLVNKGLFSVNEDGTKLMMNKPYVTTGEYTLYQPYFDIKSRTSAFYKAYYTKSGILVEDGEDNQLALAEMLAYFKSLVNFVTPLSKNTANTEANKVQPQPVSEPPMTNPDRDYLQSIIDGEVDPLTIDFDALIALAEKYDGDTEITPLLDQALDAINQAEQELAKGI
jgi:hypothetical protein